ncbi:MAG: 30S ribosomal protein S17 [Candidatus Shapirobacteria bacterium]|nr:30S ribosomal protein S17 [Candidatus Shapirobacteria bacterium]MDD5073924.1 30S ribosomal protein S17 [Candidatus Shapirobacteria bacterium]MDD5481560.1 30S ribosomal protein S17 [Candidatus Shapirobacteria bacterium]
MIKKIKNLTGVVVSKPSLKTVKVLVETTASYPKYKKVFIRRKTYLVHDEKESAGVGDRVVIVSVRPISKRKNFNIKEIIK